MTHFDPHQGTWALFLIAPIFVWYTTMGTKKTSAAMRLAYVSGRHSTLLPLCKNITKEELRALIIY